MSEFRERTFLYVSYLLLFNFLVNITTGESGTESAQATDYKTEEPCFGSRQGRDLLFSEASRPALVSLTHIQ